MPNKPFEGLHAEMQRIKQEKERKRSMVRNQTNEHLETVQAVRGIVAPLINDFVSGDNHLSIQSSNSRNFFVGFASLHVCRIALYASDPDSVQIILESDSGQSSSLYYGSVNQEAIKAAVQSALIRWYQLVS